MVRIKRDILDPFVRRVAFRKDQVVVAVPVTLEGKLQYQVLPSRTWALLPDAVSVLGIETVPPQVFETLLDIVRGGRSLERTMQEVWETANQRNGILQASGVNDQVLAVQAELVKVMMLAAQMRDQGKRIAELANAGVQSLRGRP